MTGLILAMVVAQSIQEKCRSCELISKAASALSEGDGGKFMSYIDKHAPRYYEIEVNVDALTSQQDISTSIDVLGETGDDNKVEAVCDFFLQLTSQDGYNTVVRRRERVTISESRGRKGWVITSIKPDTILLPVIVK